MKKCPGCEKEKPLTEFYKNRRFKDGVQSYCKICWRTKQSSPEAKKVKNECNLRTHRSEKRSAYLRNWQLQKKYGISERDYQNLLATQFGRCAICGILHSDCHNGLYVDHDHKSNKIRKLLCRDCNAGIGYFRESIDLLNKAIEYLMNHTNR